MRVARLSSACAVDSLLSLMALRPPPVLNAVDRQASFTYRRESKSVPARSLRQSDRVDEDRIMTQMNNLDRPADSPVMDEQAAKDEFWRLIDEAREHQADVHRLIGLCASEDETPATTRFTWAHPLGLVIRS